MLNAFSAKLCNFFFKEQNALILILNIKKICGFVFMHSRVVYRNVNRCGLSTTPKVLCFIKNLI